MHKYFIFFLFIPLCFAETENLNELIRKPLISRKCKELISQRDEKILIKQKLNSLVMRSNKLIKEAKPNQKLGKGKLEYTQIKLKNQLRFTTMQIKSMEENIVRQGCPGIVL